MLMSVMYVSHTSLLNIFAMCVSLDCALCRWLVDQGARVDARNSARQTPYDQVRLTATASISSADINC
jgi:hypothetical protein